MRNRVYGIQLYKLIDVIEDASSKLSDVRVRFGEIVSVMKDKGSFRDFGTLNMVISPVYATLANELAAAASDVLIVWDFASAFSDGKAPRLRVTDMRLAAQRAQRALKEYYEGKINYERAYSRLKALYLRRASRLERLLHEGVARLSEAGVLGRRSTAPPVSIIGLGEGEGSNEGGDNG